MVISPEAVMVALGLPPGGAHAASLPQECGRVGYIANTCTGGKRNRFSAPDVGDVGDGIEYIHIPCVGDGILSSG